MNRSVLVVAALGSILCVGSVQADDYYVSAARGKGKKGSKDEPARDLGVIASKLKAGDTVHIAAGTYLGLSESGIDEISAPVRVIGGYSDDFTTRDPWGQHKTILSGNNQSKNFASKARLHVGDRRGGGGGEIVIDGIVVDNGARNGYLDGGAMQISRRYNPKTGSNAAPDSPGISVDAPEGCKVTIVNCAVMNCAPTHKVGAIKVFGSKNVQATIRNNLVVNNTGAGICCLSSWHPRDGQGLPQFAVENNTVLFTWKFDPLATDSGSSLKLESDVIARVRGNAFACSEAFCIDNAAKVAIAQLEGNLLFAASQAAYREFSTDIEVAGFDEEAQRIEQAADNVAQAIVVPAPEAWAKAYAARVVVDRQKAEADVQVQQTRANELRSMLGLPLQGSELKLESPVWLHRIDTEGALRCGMTAFAGKFGCSNPAAAAPAQLGR